MDCNTPEEETMGEQQEQQELARSWGHAASDAFHASAAYFRTLPDDAWSGPTGCADWNERVLAGHIVGEAVWFPNMVKSATAGELSHPDGVHGTRLMRLTSRLLLPLRQNCIFLRKQSA